VPVQRDIPRPSALPAGAQPAQIALAGALAAPGAARPLSRGVHRGG
jgi:hypothetical protein